jgi:hypothetical protein
MKFGLSSLLNTVSTADFPENADSQIISDSKMSYLLISQYIPRMEIFDLN